MISVDKIMNITLNEKYVRLSSIQVGETATSKDRESFFVCGLYYDELEKNNVKVIIDMNNLCNQYSDARDTDQLVKILKSGDRFTCSI
jgi:hypothetical protein